MYKDKVQYTIVKEVHGAILYTALDNIAIPHNDIVELNQINTKDSESRLAPRGKKRAIHGWPCDIPEYTTYAAYAINVKIRLDMEYRRVT
ncbi:hypothetical protein M8J76_010200 [Diaphorina citri]|nr:hypothetical protein M8J76_010200 [Diaphorina citri]